MLFKSIALPKTFYFALFAMLLFSIGLTISIPIVPIFITGELGLAEHWIGTASLFVAGAAVVTRIPAGAFSDQHGRRKIMMIGALLGTVAAILYVTSQSLAVFLLARLCVGVSLGLFTTSMKALAADLAPPEQRGEVLGLSNAAFSLALIISPLLGEGLMKAAGAHAVFALSGGLSLMALVVTYFLPRTKPKRSTNSGAGGDIKDLLQQRGTWAAMFMVLAASAVMTLMFTFYPLFAERKMLYVDAPRLIVSIAMGLGLSIWAATDTLIEPFAGKLSDRFGRQTIAAPSLLVMLLGLVAFNQATNTASAYLAIVLLAAGWGSMRATADAISQDALSPVLRGMGAAVLYTSYDLAIGFESQGLGQLINGDDFSRYFQVTASIVLGFGIAGILLATRLKIYAAQPDSFIPLPETELLVRG